MIKVRNKYIVFVEFCISIFNSDKQNSRNSGYHTGGCFFSQQKIKTMENKLEQINKLCDGLREMLLREYYDESKIDVAVSVNSEFEDNKSTFENVWKEFKIRKLNYKIEIEILK